MSAAGKKGFGEVNLGDLGFDESAPAPAPAAKSPASTSAPRKRGGETKPKAAAPAKPVPAPPATVKEFLAAKEREPKSLRTFSLPDRVLARLEAVVYAAKGRGEKITLSSVLSDALNAHLDELEKTNK